MLTDAEALRNLRNRIPSLRDLAPGIALKIFAEIRSAPNALHASKLGRRRLQISELFRPLPQTEALRQCNMNRAKQKYSKVFSLYKDDFSAYFL
jgi:hypothetical protein